MRPQVWAFAEDVAERCAPLDPVVEIGARPADGQEADAGVRRLFAGREYIGCDVQAGIGVDRIEDVHRLTFEDESVGTVIAFDTLEHVSDPIRALEEIHRVLKPGGTVAISSVMFFVIHAHPWDFWRFTPEGFGRLLEPFEQRLVLAEGWELMPESVFGVGVKGPSPSLDRSLLPRTAALGDHWGEGKPIGMGPFRWSLSDLWRYTLQQSVQQAKARIRR